MIFFFFFHSMRSVLHCELKSDSVVATLPVDVTEVALEWAEKNVKNNPHISGLIEIRKVDNSEEVAREQLQIGDIRDCESNRRNFDGTCTGTPVSCPAELHSGVKMSYEGPPILVGVVKDEETFDFCMCNPPFFQTMEEAGLNPKTACGGTSKEMVCPGGEQAFITRIIEDSVKLKQTFRSHSCIKNCDSCFCFDLKKHSVNYLFKGSDFYLPVVGGTPQWLGKNQI